MSKSYTQLYISYRWLALAPLLFLLLACSDGGSGNSSNTSNSSSAPPSSTVPALSSSYSLAVTTSGLGTVLSDAIGVNCGNTCSANYNADARVTLTASAASGYQFSGWSGNDLSCPGTGSCSVAMNKNWTVTATFTAVSPIPPLLGSVPSLNVVNTGARSQSNAPVTFGHAFKAGDVPAGVGLAAKLSNGTDIPLQLDAKATHADGSLRHGIVTLNLSTLAAGAAQTVHLSTASASHGTGVSLSKLLATTFDAIASLKVGATTYTASAQNLLRTTTPRAWLSGPLVSEWIVGGPVKTADGKPHEHLTAYFHVRAYAGVNRVRVDMVIENNWTLVPKPQDFTYDVTLTVGGVTAYSQAGLTHYQHARWHKRAWWGGDPQIYVKLDTTYLQDSKAIPKYETLTPTEAFLNSVRQSTPPMDKGDQTQYMSQGGGQDAIGPLPRWDSVYAVSGDQRAYNYMNANADGGAVYPIHFRDELTKLPATIDSYPNADLNGSSSSNPIIPSSSTANQNNPGGSSHRPSIGYLAYLVTGDYFYLEEMQFWNSYELMWASSSSRGGAYGYGGNGATGIWYTGSLRGQAWAYRNLAQVASITPDADPLKSYFNTKLNNNLAYDKWQYVDGHGPQSNRLGMMYQAGRDDPSSRIYGEYRMWYDNFISWAFQYVVELGFSNAIPMRDYKAKTAIGMMGLAANESCFQLVPRYVSNVGPGSSYFATFKEVYDATVPGASKHVCGSQAMANYLTSIEDHTYVINEMTGGQNDTYYYFSSMQPALAAAADSGLSGGVTAWNRSRLSGVHPDYRDMPIWAVIPRGNSTPIPRPTPTTTPTPTPVLAPTPTPSPALTVSLAASSTSVVSGDTSTLMWSSTNATGCTASGAWSGSRARAGTEATGALSATRTYILTCTGAGGASATRSVTITVSSAGGFVPPYTLPLPGQAIALGTQTAQAIRPASHYPGAWQYTLFDSYGGGVLMPSYSKAGAYAIAGTGGHNSPEHTGGVVFDFETGTWQLLTDASGTPVRMDPYYVADTNGSPEYEIALGATTPNAVPAPPHPFMNLMPLPTELGGGPLGSLVYAIQSGQASESVTSTRAHRFDLSTRTWSRYTSNHLAFLGGTMHDAPSVYDPTAKRIWQLPTQIHSTQNIGYIDLTEASPQWRLSATWPWTPTWDGTHSAWLDDTRRLILMQSPTRLVALDLNNLTAGPRVLNFSGTLPPSGNRWEFYPPDGSFYNKGNTGNEVWKLTPPIGNPLTGTWAITSFIVSGATLPDISPSAQLYGARHFTRFFYVPSIAAFAWIADSYSPVMLIRPPSTP